MRSSFIVFLGLLAGAAVFPLPLVAQQPENVLLVINQKSADSRTVGEYYARRRGIPEFRICRLQTPEQQSVSRKVFEEEIREPVADCIRSRGLHDSITVIVTTKGLPLVVEGRRGPVGDLASVDSELTTLYRFLIFGRIPSSGRLDNPYHAAGVGGLVVEPFDRRRQSIYLVSRLTAGSAVEALLLIDRGLKADEDRPVTSRLLFDLPSQRRTLELDWLEEAASNVEKLNGQVVWERSAAPLTDIDGAFGYVGWGLRDEAFQAADLEGKWAPGAVAITFDGDSADLVCAGQDGVKGSPSARLLEAGLTGLGAFVDDPTVDGYFRPQILFAAYLRGMSLVESFYLSLRYLSWREVVIGDPLASPYAARSADRRESLEPCGNDQATGLPACFAVRRRDYLMDRYSTSQEVADKLLKAENLFHQGREEEAFEAVGQSLQLDPYIAESHHLKARLLEKSGRFQESFDHYRKTVEHGGRNSQLYRKLAGLAAYQLKDARLAQPYASILYSEMGSDAEVARLWAHVLEGLGERRRALSVYLRIAGQVEPPVWAPLKLARLYLEDGDQDTAATFLKQARQRLQEAPQPEFLRQLEELQNQAPQGGLQQESDAADAPASDETVSPQAQVQSQSEPQTETQAGPTVRPAQVLRRAPTVYPDGARRAGVEGVVVLKLLIDERGQMLKSDLVHGSKELAKAARKSVLDWQFSPRTVNGRPEPSYLTVSIQFKIEH